MNMNQEWIPAGHENWCQVRITENGIRFAVNRQANDILDFDAACDYNALSLKKDYPHSKFYLSFSGGMDSELVAKVLLRNKIDFVPVVLEIGTVNALETWYAHYWCWSHNIKPLVISLSYDQYQRKVMPLLGKLKHTHNHGSIINLWLGNHIRDLGGTMVTGLCDINYDCESKRFFNDVMDWSNEVFNHSIHPCGFFCYTPELAASYVNQFDTSIHEQYNKSKFYGIAPRPKITSVHMIANATPFISSMMDKFWQHNNRTEVNWLGTKDQVLAMLTKT
jgi:hypothetical protein